VIDLIRAYVMMKLRFRLDNSIGDQVPLVQSLYIKVQNLVREQSFKGNNTLNLSVLFLCLYLFTY
jgi:hypothetical protein